MSAGYSTAPIVILLFFSTGVCVSRTSWNISSPSDKVKATVQLADLGGEADYPAGEACLYYSVSAGGPATYSEVVQPSPMGIERSDRSFLSGLVFISESEVLAIDSIYTMVTGKRSLCRNRYNEKTLSFRTADGLADFDVCLRAYDDGFAFRYVFPETNDSIFSITEEATGFRPPANSTMWMLAYNTTADEYAPAYEDIWKRNLTAGEGTGKTAKPSDSSWCFPALYRTPAGCWALLWETDVTPSYCNSHLSKARQLVYRIAFPNASEAENLGAVAPSSSLPWVMPWRAIITGTSPGTILESTLSTDLATPSTISDASWIKPGRSSWSWWSQNRSPFIYDSLKPFIDLAAQMTWEYSLVDAGWDSLKGGTWQQLVTYAASKNVGINLWYNAGGPCNSITTVTPRNRLDDSARRDSEFQTISAAGVKGIKVDFWLSDKQSTVKYYCDVFSNAAKHKLLVNIHGCTVPRGWQRTYPNLISAEANRGAENYIWYADDGDRFPWQNTILPFTRNAVASMDWTPVTFTNLSNRHKTSFGHELALSVIFESGIQHFADRVAGYQTSTIPDIVQKFLKEVPVAWDDTKYLGGYPGSWVALARRKETDWYAAGIAGDTARTMTIRFGFLEGAPARYQTSVIIDGSNATTFNELVDTAGADDSIVIAAPARGGWVARFVSLTASGTVTPATPVQAAAGTDRKDTHYIVAAGGSFRLPGVDIKQKPQFAVYDLSGRLIRIAAPAPGSAIVNMQRDLMLPCGVYLVRVHTGERTRSASMQQKK